MISSNMNITRRTINKWRNRTRKKHILWVTEHYKLVAGSQFCIQIILVCKTESCPKRQILWSYRHIFVAFKNIFIINCECVFFFIMPNISIYINAKYILKLFYSKLHYKNVKCFKLYSFSYGQDPGNRLKRGCISDQLICTFTKQENKND